MNAVTSNKCDSIRAYSVIEIRMNAVTVFIFSRIDCFNDYKIFKHLTCAGKLLHVQKLNY